MRLALDAMGGDHAPGEIVRGAVAARDGLPDDEILLVGDQAAIRKELDAAGASMERLTVVHASQQVGMAEPPVEAMRRKPDSSMRRAMELMARREADAVVSAGNTGAFVAAAHMVAKRLPGIRRPGISVVFPSFHGPVVVIDVGANVDCAPEHLVHFALMGATYARDVLGRASPRIGLLNIGTEKTKGNKLNYHAYEILQQGPLPFAGNVEPHRLLTERPVDVVVCDGFVGNILLKAVEGGVAAVSSHLRRGIARRPSAKIGALFLRPVFAELRETLSYERRGGAPLLGVDGIVVIAHGRSDAAAIDGAIDVARRAVEGHLKERLEQGIGGWDKNGG